VLPIALTGSNLRMSVLAGSLRLPHETHRRDESQTGQSRVEELRVIQQSGQWEIPSRSPVQVASVGCGDPSLGHGGAATSAPKVRLHLARSETNS